MLTSRKIINSIKREPFYIAIDANGDGGLWQSHHILPSPLLVPCKSAIFFSFKRILLVMLDLVEINQGILHKPKASKQE
jgi:hypothetical protein